MQTETTQIKEKSTDELLREGLSKAVSYQEYRRLVEILVQEGTSAGPIQSDDLANYTKLNSKRMNRWDKSVLIDDEDLKVIQKMESKVTWLVLTESWCGDAAPALPVMAKIAELNPNITFKVILRDENVPLMNKFLTNGGLSIPKLIVLDGVDGSVLGTWGPRSKKATKLVEAHKASHGTILPEFKQDLQVWYNTDKGQSILEDLLVVLALE